MSSIQHQIDARNTCVFCYKTFTRGDFNSDIGQESAKNSVNIVNRFFKFLERFCSEQNKVEIVDDLDWSKYLGCCENCLDIADTFCENYHQLQLLELQLTWNLERLANIMKLAGRVPSRVAKLKQVFERNITRQNNYRNSDTLDESWKDEFAVFKRFRHTVSKRCSRRLAKSKPRVLVRRTDIIDDYHLRPSSTIPHQDICDNDAMDKSLSELNAGPSTCTSPVAATIPLPVALDKEDQSEDTAAPSEVMSNGITQVNSEVETESNIGQDESNSVMVYVKIEKPEDSGSWDDDETERYSSQKYNLRLKNTQSVLKLEDKDHESSLSSSDSETNSNSAYYENDHYHDEATNSSSNSIHLNEHESINVQTIENEPKPSISRKRKRCVMELQYKTVECPKCDKLFLNENTLKIHQQKVHVSRTFECSECDKTYKTKSQLHRHISAHSFKFPCPSCDKKFRRKVDWEQHMHTVHNNKIATLFSCQTCDKKFITENRLNNHVKIVHGESNHLCTECGKAFKDRYKLDRHMLIHQGPDSWKFECSICGRKHYTNANLKSHMRTHGNAQEEKRIPCNYCEEAFPSQQKLTLHIQAEHQDDINDGPKTFNCSKCEQQFLSESRMRSHLNVVHRTAHKCSECGKVLQSESHLKRHSFIHKSRSDWKYNCNKCEFTAYTKGNLKQHMIKHERKSKKVEGKTKARLNRHSSKH